jgi:hypothetical protein
LYLNVAGESVNDLYKVERAVKEADLRHKNKITFNFNQTIGRGTYNGSPEDKKKELDSVKNISEGEYSTIDALYHHCTASVQQGKKALVYYFHSKSASSLRESLPVVSPPCGCCEARKAGRPCACCQPEASWREGMNAFNLEFPSVCARALLRHGYSVCGIENQDAHYSGNFWWADCQHIAALNPPHTR